MAGKAPIVDKSAFSVSDISINGGVISFASAMAQADADTKKVTVEGKPVMLDGSTIQFTGVAGPAGAVAGPVSISFNATVSNTTMEGKKPLVVGDKNNSPVTATFVQGLSSTPVSLTATFLVSGATKVTVG